jgi:hypothetical protein
MYDEMKNSALQLDPVPDITLYMRSGQFDAVTIWNITSIEQYSSS